MAIAITVSLVVILCAGTIIFCRRYIQETYSAVDAVLDDALMHHTKFSAGSDRDDRLAKLTHKARKLTQVNAISSSRTKKEKEAIQSFLSDLSHQMKTPLSGVAMYTDLILAGNLSAGEQQEFLTRIHSGVEKLQWMMDSLMKMSRLEVGAIELVPVPASIKQTISDSIGTVLASAAQKNITIQTAAFTDVHLLHDSKWTAEAMSNILENAIKYSKLGSEIHITLETLPIYTKISFVDHGTGIGKEEWNSIFKRFYRGKNAEDTKGAGLGLYLTAVILEKQGGYILVDSIPGQYTSFSMFLQNCKK